MKKNGNRKQSILDEKYNFIKKIIIYVHDEHNIY